jgi:hypothetical protein
MEICMDNGYVETDLAGASFALASGCTLDKVVSLGRSKFGFQFIEVDVQKAQKAVRDFYSHALIDGKAFSDAMRDLKGRMYNAKRIEESNDKNSNSNLNGDHHGLAYSR